MFKLSINNFQSIKQAVIEFTPGKLTVVTGENLSGKTAVLRALDALILNPKHGKTYIRSGQDIAIVQLNIDDLEIIWYRTRKTVVYTVNGKRYEKSGTISLYDIVPNFPLIYDDIERKVLNIQGEHDRLFPFTKTPAGMFALLEDMYQISDTGCITDSIKGDLLESKTDIISTNENIESNQVKIQCIDDIVSEVDLEYMSDIHNDLIDFDSEISDMEKDLNNANMYQSKVGIFIDRMDFDLSSIDDIALMINDLNNAKEFQEFMQYDIDRACIDLSMFDDVEDLLDSINKAEDILEDMEDLESQIYKLESKQKGINRDLLKIDKCPTCGQKLRKKGKGDE